MNEIEEPSRGWMPRRELTEFDASKQQGLRVAPLQLQQLRNVDALIAAVMDPVTCGHESGRAFGDEWRLVFPDDLRHQVGRWLSAEMHGHRFLRLAQDADADAAFFLEVLVHPRLARA